VKQNELAASSMRWMQTALEAFLRNESLDFSVHHAGVALEHLLKAYLCSHHPALIVEAKDNNSGFQSLLHAVGLGDQATLPITRTKTIGLRDAFTRTRQLLKGKITVTDGEFALIFAARNGVAHMGIHDTGRERAILTTCVRIATPVLDALSAPPPNYWGQYKSLVGRLVNEHVTVVQARTEAKIDQAKLTFSQRFSGEPSPQREAVIVALSAASSLSPIGSDYDKQVDCPACEGKGWLHGKTTVEWFNRGGEDDPDTAVVTFYPDAFDCSVCGLNLKGDELEEADLPQQEYLLDEDPDDHLGIDEDAAYESYRDDRFFGDP
jgi:hypothetical protein